MIIIDSTIFILVYLNNILHRTWIFALNIKAPTNMQIMMDQANIANFAFVIVWHGCFIQICKVRNHNLEQDGPHLCQTFDQLN